MKSSCYSFSTMQTFLGWTKKGVRLTDDDEDYATHCLADSSSGVRFRKEDWSALRKVLSQDQAPRQQRLSLGDSMTSFDNTSLAFDDAGETDVPPSFTSLPQNTFCRSRTQSPYRKSQKSTNHTDPLHLFQTQIIPTASRNPLPITTHEFPMSQVRRFPVPHLEPEEDVSITPDGFLASDAEQTGNLFAIASNQFPCEDTELDAFFSSRREIMLEKSFDSTDHAQIQIQKTPTPRKSLRRRQSTSSEKIGDTCSSKYYRERRSSTSSTAGSKSINLSKVAEKVKDRSSLSSVRLPKHAHRRDSRSKTKNRETIDGHLEMILDEDHDLHDEAIWNDCSSKSEISFFSQSQKENRGGHSTRGDRKRSSRRKKEAAPLQICFSETREKIPNVPATPKSMDSKDSHTTSSRSRNSRSKQRRKLSNSPNRHSPELLSPSIPSGLPLQSSSPIPRSCSNSPLRSASPAPRLCSNSSLGRLSPASRSPSNSTLPPKAIRPQKRLAPKRREISKPAAIDSSFHTVSKDWDWDQTTVKTDESGFGSLIRHERKKLPVLPKLIEGSDNEKPHQENTNQRECKEASQQRNELSLGTFLDDTLHSYSAHELEEEDHDRSVVSAPAVRITNSSGAFGSPIVRQRLSIGRPPRPTINKRLPINAGRSSGRITVRERPLSMRCAKPRGLENTNASAIEKHGTSDFRSSGMVNMSRTQSMQRKGEVKNALAGWISSEDEGDDSFFTGFP